MIDRSTRMTRRRYLVFEAFQYGASWWSAMEAVATTAVEHPEWDLDEERTWREWETAPNRQVART
jgi:hypothetical protein